MRFTPYMLAAALCAGVGAAPAHADDAPAGDPSAEVMTDAQITVKGPYRVARSGDLVLRAPMGADEVQLFVAHAEADRPGHYYTLHTGKDLDAIVEAHPDLAERPGYDALRRVRFEACDDDCAMLALAPWRLTFVEGPIRYETWRGGETAYVYVTTDAGTTVYPGKDFDAIVEAYPILRENPATARMRHRLAAVPDYRLRSNVQTHADAHQGWLDLEVAPEATTVRLYEFNEDGTWARRVWTGADYRVIARQQPVFRERGSTWFDLDFDLDLPDLPKLPPLPQPFN